MSHRSSTQGRLFAAFKTYVGQTRDRWLVQLLERAGIGECTTRGQLPPRRSTWFYDNGAFEDFQAGRPFNYLQWSRDMRAIRYWVETGVGRGCKQGQPMTAPDFVVVPDIVAGGNQSLTFSLCHLAEAKACGAPCYLAVQDGMTEAAVRSVLAHGFDGIFVGGTLDWKLETGAAWCELGRALGLPVHVGRVGTVERVKWAASVGVSSIDSSLPLWTRGKLEAFLEEVA